MRFGIRTLDELDVKGKTVLCRVDINQPVDRAKGTLKSVNRIRACVPTVRELSDKGAKVVLMAHQGSDIEYKNFYTTRPHAQVLSELLGREVKWIDDVCGPAAREAIAALREGEVLLLDNVRFVAEEQTLFEMKLRLTHEQQAKTLLVEKLAPSRPPIGTSPASAASSKCSPPPWGGFSRRNIAPSPASWKRRSGPACSFWAGRRSPTPSR